MKPQLVGTLLFLSPVVATGATFVVNSTVDKASGAPGTGVCATGVGVCTLRAAIQEANAAPGETTITLPAGTYVLTIPGRGLDASAGDLNVIAGKNVVINGAGAAATIIDANFLDRAFATACCGQGFEAWYGGSITLNDVTVQNGRPSGDGGAISANPGWILVRRSVLKSNYAPNGGAIAARNGVFEFPARITVIDSIITDNGSADLGGGIFIISCCAGANAGLEVSGSTISGNSANRGGGIASRVGPYVLVSNSSISGNTAAGLGGAIYLDQTRFNTTEILSTTITANSSAAGGAVAIFSTGTTPLLHSSLRNTIIANNGGAAPANCWFDPAGSPGLGDSGNNLEFPASGVPCFSLPATVRADPQLLPLANNGGPTPTHALMTGSPAIDAGDDATCAAAPVSGVDQRGVARPVGSHCDIGAYEGGGPPPAVAINGVSSITAATATLNGTVNPNGLDTSAWFQYGATTSYGLTTTVQAMGSGFAALPIGGGAIAGLTCNTTYHFRAVANSSGGTTAGLDATFTTSPCVPPAATTGFPTGFSVTGATLNGTVNPNGNATTAWFEYGLTTGYGSSTPTQALGSIGIGLAIGGGTVSGLVCNTVYHFRATATSSNGTTNGLDRTFSPPCAGTLSPTLLAVANDINALRVFNAATLAPVATIPVPATDNFSNSDVVVMPNQALAFAARLDGIWVIDLTQSPPALAAGVNPIPTPRRMPFVEDLSLTRNGRFLVASDGSAFSPIAVIDTSTRAVLDTYLFLTSHNSVEVCDNGSVLVTSVPSGNIGDPPAPPLVRRLTIGATGALTDTGQSLALPGARPNNAICAPGGTVGIVVNYLTGDLRSFALDGMTSIATQALPGSGGGLSVAISRDGTKVFSRDVDFLTAYAFNPATGVFGPQLWATNVGTATAFYGVDRIALNPSGQRVFATTTGFVLTLDASTGALNGSAAATTPSGIALRAWASPISGDYDDDSKDDLALYRPSTGTWYVKASTGAALIQPWGLSTDIPVSGDYDGDGKADLAIYRPSTGVWYILQSSTNFTTYLAQAWGLSTDLPVPGDYDGDGKTDPAVFRPSTGVWYILQSSTHYTTYLAPAWGLSTDVVVPGDYDGDGKTDPAVFRPSTGTWYLLQSSTSFTTYRAQTWGISTDIAVSGDYDGDGKTDPAVFRPSTGVWYLLQSSTDYGTYVAPAWGLDTDTPVPGDYDGDSKMDPAVYRPSTGNWYFLTSGSDYTTYIGQAWGLGSDTPINKRP